MPRSRRGWWPREWPEARALTGRPENAQTRCAERALVSHAVVRSGVAAGRPYAERMYEPPSPSVFQRSHGVACVRFEGARLIDLRQSGAAKAFLPRAHSACPEVVFLNTSGGLTGGDRLEWRLGVDGGGRIVGATQTAERGYAAAGMPARVGVHLNVGAGASLDWLPQETILYDQARLDRLTSVEMAGDARLVWCEMLILGRVAMGERLGTLHLNDQREVRRAGRLVLLDPVRLRSDALDGSDAEVRSALVGGAKALGSVILFAPGAEDALAPLRNVLPDPDVVPGLEAAASAWDGRAIVRVMSRDPLAMKRTVAAALAVMRRGAPLPRVWQI
ncbi:MAG: urease accessory protein UreD [Alkalilacustris sp.]